MTPFSIEWLRSAGAAGDIADVTGRLSGDKAELDFQGRQKGDSKLKLLAIRSVKTCLASGEIVPDDLMLIYDGKGSVVRAGIVTPDLHLMFFMGRRGKEDDGLRPAADVISRRSAAAYCARWRKAAGVKVLRKPWLPYRYTKREYYVPMRDGVRLYTAVYEAAGMARGGGAAIPEEGPKPIILMRSPYPVGTYGYGGVGDLSDKIRCFAERGYVIAEQNVRGTFMSEGEFEDVRPPAGRSAGNPGATDEATDTWDTVEWLLRNTRNNGSVGVYGVSYPGFYATMAAVCGHPAIKIASPQAPVTDWWMGDDAHHNGVLMLADMYSFGGGFFRPKGNPTPDPRESTAPVPEGADLYGFFRGKAISEILRPFLGSGPTGVKGESALAPENDAPSEVPLKGFADIAAHPDYDSFWRERNPLRLLRGVKPAVLVVGGLYDAEDAWGSIHTWRALREQSPETESYFVYGPWAHGGWRKDAGYLENIEAPVFEYYLEGKGAKCAAGELPGNRAPAVAYGLFRFRSG